MKYFMDTEFIEDGKTIDLLSIGIVREDGLMYYAESSEADYAKASDWVKENVFPHLLKTRFLKTREQIKNNIIDFTRGDDNIEFWGYYSDYDWVVFCQLFGKMIDLPEGFPMFCLDVKQRMHMLNYDKADLDVAENLEEHNALADAKEIKYMYDAIEGLMR